MKTKLHNTLFVCALALMGLQEVQAQYSGVAYNGITPQLGVTVGVPVKIELENYDALSRASSGDGANFGVNTDSSAIAYGTQSVRLSSQFDIELVVRDMC